METALATKTVPAALQAAFARACNLPVAIDAMADVDALCERERAARERPLVHALTSRHSRVLSMYADKAAADAKAAAYNADPFIEPGTPDDDAPYTVESWAVAS